MEQRRTSRLNSKCTRLHYYPGYFAYCTLSLSLSWPLHEKWLGRTRRSAQITDQTNHKSSQQSKIMELQQHLLEEQFEPFLAEADGHGDLDFGNGVAHRPVVRPSTLHSFKVPVLCVAIGVAGALVLPSVRPVVFQKLMVLATACFILWLSLSTMMQPSSIPIDAYNETRQTWFGHRMSKEGEWSHIPVVLCATYSFVFAYGSLVSLISPATNVVTIPAFYVCGLIGFYMWHLAAHQCEGSELHRHHMEHHQERYPQRDYYGDEHPAVQQERQDRGKPHTLLSLMNPVASTTTSLAHEGPLLFIVALVVIFARMVLAVSLASCFFALLGYALMAAVGTAMHMSFHERDFQLEPYAWYRELRSLHMIHHMHRKNYAMVNVLLDVAFGSLLLVDQ